PLGMLQETAPVAWQERAGQRVPVAARWAADSIDLGEVTWGFALGSYDPTLPLTIDPTVLAYATYIGGSVTEVAYAIAVDGTGAAYVAGVTSSTETSFPNGGGFGVPGFDQTHNGGTFDAFVVKLAPNGLTLVYATYLGGSAADFGIGIAVDG